MKKKILITIIVLLIITMISLIFIVVYHKNISDNKSKNSNLNQMKEVLNKAILDYQMQYSNVFREDNKINANEFFTPQKLASILESQGYYLYSSQDSKPIDSSMENELETFSNNQVYYMGSKKAETEEYLEFKVSITNDGVNVSFP